MPFYVSPEQVMKDKADYARKNIARGRDVVVIAYDGGILFVAPNPSRALHKISEIYDRIAFAAVGKYNEFENLRSAGVRYADVNGYMYDRSDVTARGLANFYAQNLGTIFTDSSKPFEVELVVAEVGAGAEDNQIYRITFDGSVVDEHGYVAMGGQADHVATVLQSRYSDGMPLAEALEVALAALGQSNGDEHTFTAGELEVAVLDRARDGRKFRRLIGSRLDDLLPAAPEPTEAPEADATPAEEPADPSDGDAEDQAAAEDANLDLPEPPSGGEGSEES
ncbi:MAG TPA: proteasome subunit alpha [Streptosporangiaceae bacterium]|jgi:proteasome alpha subunit